MSSSLPAYSSRHLNPELARAYQGKFQKSFARRLSTHRESKLVNWALDTALDWLNAERGISKQNVELLDYPCGAGRFALMSAAKVAGYLAGDHSPHMLDLTTLTITKAGLGSRLLGTTEGDARRMALEDNCVDLALSMRLLHHFEKRKDRIQILSELRRVSRGPLVTSFLNADSTKQRRHVARLARRGKTSRRILITPTTFAEEAHEAGWYPISSWDLSNFFSGQRIVCLRPLNSYQSVE